MIVNPLVSSFDLHDAVFYGLAHQNGGIASWYLLDLHAFHAALIRQAQNGYPIRYGNKRNADGTAFKWFDIESFPREPPMVVARSSAADLR